MHDEQEDRLTALYRRVMRRLIDEPATRVGFLGGVAVLLVAAVARAARAGDGQDAAVRQQERIAGRRAHAGRHAARDHAGAAARAGRRALRDAAVISVQSYTGTASPYTFNGLVRHYFLRREPNLADLQVMLTPKDDRREQSHDVAKRLRDAADAGRDRARRGDSGRGGAARARRCCRRSSPRSTVPTPARRLRARAHRPRDVFEQTAGVVDVDWYVESARPKRRLEVDAEKSRRRRSVARPRWRLSCRWPAPARRPVCCTIEQAREAVPVVLRLPRAGARIARRGAERCGSDRARRRVGELHAMPCRRRGAEHLSQEPAAGDLRHRRRRRAASKARSTPSCR